MNTHLKTLSKTKKVFYIAALQLVFVRDGDAPEVRHTNVIIETADGCVTREHLTTIQKTGIGRVCSEMGIEPDAVKDLVILNISSLGLMTPKHFLGETDTANALPA